MVCSMAGVQLCRSYDTMQFSVWNRFLRVITSDTQTSVTWHLLSYATWMYRILRLYFCIASRTVAGEVGIFQPVRCFVSGCFPVLTCAYVPQCRHFRSTPGKLGLFLFKLCHWRTPHVWQGMVLHTKRSPTSPTSFRDLPAMSSVLYLCEGITNANANASASAVAFISSIFLKMDKTELN